MTTAAADVGKMDSISQCGDVVAGSWIRDLLREDGLPERRRYYAHKEMCG